MRPGEDAGGTGGARGPDGRDEPGGPDPDGSVGSDDALGREAWAKRGVVVVAVAVAVAFVLGGIPGLIASSGPEPAQLNNSEYPVSELGVTQIPAEGDVEADVSGSGTVVIDRSHANRFSRADIEPLYRTLTRAGYEVEFHDRGALGPALSDADAFVVIDPGSPYDETDADALRSFTEDGGRLLVLGEPNRVRVTAGLGGVSTTQQVSELSNLGAEFGLSFSTGYVYHQSANDGNYKRPLASPVGDAEGVGDEVALYTAATVRPLDDGEVVLRLDRGGRLSSQDRTARYPVAVRTEGVLAVGDKTFLRADRYNVADNEDFVAYLVEFLTGGERAGGDIDGGTGDGGGTETATATPTGTPNGTATPTGTPGGGSG
ncbi:DUF4350 domain-containing protein [Halobaculum sp. EA56]|uniref:DUF4350 domain-containing protein n=1 Tax=Halobaculum sp. EA56 TaxID=3421648 RepID=UPI003EB6A42A